MGDRPESGDGLVLPEGFPCRSGDIRAGDVREAAARLVGMGEGVDSRMETVVGLWGGLPGVYEAPEADQVYALMAPAAAAAETVKGKFAAAGRALGAFADEIEPVAVELEVLEGEAAAFRAWEAYSQNP